MSTGTVGAFTFVLHSHIPYVLSHGRWPHGSDWLHEVAAETYIPLLNALNKLVDEGYSPKITIGLTPVLVEQLADEGFALEFAAHLRMRIQSAEKDIQSFTDCADQTKADLAIFWRDWYSGILDDFKNKYDRSIVKAFKALQDAGHIEIITSSATHGYSPLLSQDSSVSAQVRTGVNTYKRHFGSQPFGYWLPECGYRPAYKWSAPVQPRNGHIDPYDRRGVEEFLRENGVRYFIAESHLLQGGKTKGVYFERLDALKELWDQYEGDVPAENPVKTTYASYLLEQKKKSDKPVFVFFRDHVTGAQVWSKQMGYPGDPYYLEFHKKHSSGGIKYWRVTSADADLGDKLIYEPSMTADRIRNHANHFVSVAKRALIENRERTGHKGVICGAYDTELYGHWWFEGIDWLYTTIKAMHDDPDIELTTASNYLTKNPPAGSISLPEGSWGEGGFHHMWLNEETQWTWPLVYEAELKMQDLLAEHGDVPKAQPILKQAARELLLLQSSDWQFSISTETSREYGEERLQEHFDTFIRLADLVTTVASGEKPIDDDWLFYKVNEERDSIFQDVDLSWFRPKEEAVKK